MLIKIFYSCFECAFFFIVLLFVCMFAFFLSFQQLRVVRAFKSTLEDMEERRSVHSLHSLHSLRSSRSHPKQLSDISYIDEDVKTPSPNDYPYDIADSQKNAVNTNNSVRNSNHNSQYITLPPQNNISDGDVHETAPLMIRTATQSNNNRNINAVNQGTPSNSPTTTSITPVNSSSPSSSTSLATATSNNRTNVTSPVARGYNLLEPTKIHETSI